MIPFPDKKYQIIYADPAWEYSNEDRIRSAKDNSLIDVNDHYPTMSMDILKGLPLQDIMDDNCLLFCWVLTPLFLECIEVCQSWGFVYRTVAFIWNKKNTHVGYYTMSNAELCVVCKKGNIPLPRGKRGIQQWLETPEQLTHVIGTQRGRHSEKPKEIRHRITEMFPTQDKIELFARPDWTDYGRGWDFWGNEVDDTLC